MGFLKGPLIFRSVCQCQCHYPPPAVAPVQSSPVSTSINYNQLVSTCIILSASSKFKEPKVSFSSTSWWKRAFGCILPGSDIGLELTTSSLRQNSSWACFGTSFSLPCINPQDLKRQRFLAALLLWEWVHIVVVVVVVVVCVCVRARRPAWPSVALGTLLAPGAQLGRSSNMLGNKI